jgi:hypothetical protein
VSAVRACEATDIESVAGLFVRVFRRTEAPAPPSLRAYMNDLYLDNPWVDPDRPSLVAVDRHDRIVGFLGVVPMPLRLRGRKLAGAIGGNFMVDARFADPLVAVRMLKRFFAAGQDLALTDTANPTAIRFWERLDGRVAHFQSMRWVLAVRPAALGLALADGEHRGPLLRAAAPVARLADRVVARRVRPPRSDVELRDASVATAFAVLDELVDDRDLRFAGSLNEFEWLVEMMRRRTRFGPLRMLTMHAGSSSPYGVVMYYPNRRDVAQLAIAAAAPNHLGSLVGALRRDAYDQGSVGIMGHADARLAMELRHLACAYIYRNDFTVLHARDESLLAPLLSGDVAMTRLTGEWWTRFQGDRFD